MRIVRDIVPSAKASRSQAAILDQSITYNEPGVSYNDSRYSYGGVYGLSDLQPIMSFASNLVPTIAGYSDIYTPFVPNTGQSIGPGFFMFITH